ncbi:MAG: hypothetical protein COA33_011650 [Fluviicola sp.]|nr:hypothetical protein [Fluviicola sp.]
MKYILAFCLIAVSYSSYSQQEKSPKLIVGIVIDQMCYEYLYRYYDKFSEGGFKS